MITYMDYDRIEDTVLWLTNSVSLKFIVSLSRKARDGSRVFHQYETEYDSKMIGTTKSRSIKRYMANFYFVLNDKDDFANGFILRANDVYCLINLIENDLLPYYVGPKRIYSIVEDKLVILKKYKEVIYPQSPTRVLKMKPVVMSYENTYQEGIQVTIGSNSFDLSLDTFVGFLHILKTTDMYNAANNLVSYAKMPPYGNNVYKRTGLGGGVPEPDFSEQENINVNNMRNKNNNFLDSLKKRRD